GRPGCRNHGEYGNTGKESGKNLLKDYPNPHFNLFPCPRLRVVLFLSNTDSIYLTTDRGVRPDSASIAFSTASMAIAVRVSSVALPTCGSNTTLFISSNGALISGSCS